MSRYRPLSAIKRVVIYCSVTPNGRPIGVDVIDHWHAERNFRRADDARLGRGKWEGLGTHAYGLAAIGYHFVINVNGVVDVGRRLTETGAHEEKANYDGIGVCLVGTDAFTPAQWQSLRRHIESTHRGRQRDRLPPLTVLGHRQLDSHKTCPGFDVPAWLDSGMAIPAGQCLSSDPA